MSGVGVPTFTSTTARWEVVDWIDPTWSSQPAAGGIAMIELPQLPFDTMWLLDHMVAFCTSTAQTSLRLYAGTVDPRYFRDGTDAGNFGVADWPAGLLLRPSSSLIARWSGCDAGAVATLTLQARVMRQVTG